MCRTRGFSLEKREMQKNHNLGIAACAFLIPLLGGAFGGLTTRKTVESNWYKTLRKPKFQPPKWVFPLAWTTLYILMGAASYLVYAANDSRSRSIALTFYAIHLLLNFSWTPTFFGSRDPQTALIIISLLDVFLVATVLYFWKISKLAAYLMLPVVAWCGFATLLNWHIWKSNLKK